jgi:hypothetical protein
VNTLKGTEMEERDIRLLIDQGVIDRPLVKKNDGKFIVSFFQGETGHLLTNQRGQVRKFSELNTVQRFLEKLGFKKFEITTD